MQKRHRLHVIGRRFNGHVDNDNSEEGFPNLLNALINVFRDHSYAIVTLNNTTVAVHCKQEPEGIFTGYLTPTREVPKVSKLQREVLHVVYDLLVSMICIISCVKI